MAAISLMFAYLFVSSRLAAFLEPDGFDCLVDVFFGLLFVDTAQVVGANPAPFCQLLYRQRLCDVCIDIGQYGVYDVGSSLLGLFFHIQIVQNG